MSPVFWPSCDGSKIGVWLIGYYWYPDAGPPPPPKRSWALDAVPYGDAEINRSYPAFKGEG